MTLKELYEKRATLKAEGRKLAEKADALSAKDKLSEDEETQLAQLGKDIEAKGADLEACQEDIDAAHAKRDRDRLFAADEARAYDEPAIPAGSAGRVSSENGGTAENGGFRVLSEFMAAVRAANPAFEGGYVDDRLRAAAPSDFNKVGGDHGEGFAIPEQHLEAIWDVVFDDPLMQMIDPVPTAGNAVNMAKDGTTPWSSAGIQAYWTGEGQKITPSELDLDGMTLKLHKIAALVPMTDELLADAPRLENHVTRKAGEAIRYKVGDAFMWGDGVAKPLGFLSAGKFISIAKKSGQTADTIVVENVDNAFGRMLGNIGDFRWLAGADSIAVMPQLNSEARPNTYREGTDSSPGGFLRGRPVVPIEQAEELGSLGDLTLFNPRGYAAYMKTGGIKGAISIHLWFDYDLQAYRWTFRIGGQPILDAPIEKSKGKPSVGHFIGLAERS